MSRSFVPKNRNGWSGGTGYITSKKEQESKLSDYSLVSTADILGGAVKLGSVIKFKNISDGALRAGGVLTMINPDYLILRGIEGKTFPVRLSNNEIYVKTGGGDSGKATQFLDWINALHEDGSLTFQYKNKDVSLQDILDSFQKYCKQG